MGNTGGDFAPEFEINVRNKKFVKSEKLIDAFIKFSGQVVSKTNIQVPSLPSFLYKYKSLDLNSPISNEYTEDALVSELIYCSNPDSLNDINDIRVNIQPSKNHGENVKLFKNVVSNNPLSRISPAKKLMIAHQLARIGVNDNIRNMLEAELRSSTSLFCTTNNPVNELMWAHYADSHKGYCIEYDVENDCALRYLMRAVRYTNKYPVFNYPVYNDKHDYYLAKSDSWSYENEFRLILPCSSVYIQLNPNTVKSVILGVRAKNELIDFFRNINNKRVLLGKNEIPIYKVGMMKDQYGLEFQRTPL